jgi:hypothetical protein
MCCAQWMRYIPYIPLPAGEAIVLFLKIQCLTFNVSRYIFNYDKKF